MKKGTTEDLEQAIIGCLLADDSQVEFVTQVLFPADFECYKAKEAYLCIKELHRAGTPIDSILLQHHMLRQEHIGYSAEELSEMKKNATPKNIRHYVFALTTHREKDFTQSVGSSRNV